MNAFVCLLKDETGSAMTEYAIILTLLSAVATAALVAISSTANTSINGVSSNMQDYELGTTGVGPP
jgi:Flp pilus assembly pilin Flp